MPLYEYQCKKCHSLTERIQKFSDDPLTICPHCGGELEKLISASSVRFKGSGWYATDYARKSSGDSGKSGNGGSSSSSADSSSSGGSAASGGGESSTAAKAKPDASSSKDGKDGGRKKK